MRKLITVLCIVVAMGLPLLETWQAVWAAVLLLGVLFGAATTWRRIGIAILVVVVAMAGRAVLPRVDIAEAHNAFLVMHDGEALERGLPPQIFRSWKAQFDALYPPDVTDADRAPWRQAGVPPSLFTQSSDAIWRQAKYTRQVDAISFHSLGEFRGGFANEGQYNFWSGELLREQMPFYVMYELTPASVGSALQWTGQLFWQRSDGGFDEIVHPAPAAREIIAGDAGRRVYAAFFPKRDAVLDFELLPSLELRISAALSAALSLIAAFTVFVLTTRPRWTTYLRALALFAAGYATMMAFLHVSAGKYLGKAYPPQGGGDDGMVHDGWGRAMAMLAGHGHVVEALKGLEPVYWFTPGTRYVRMLEKLVFGDTNHLFALIVPCVLIALFFLFRHLVGERWAWAATAAVCVLPVENISYLQYVANAKLGYGEAIGGVLFLAGLVVLLRSEPSWGGEDTSYGSIALGGAALAASMFIRPNFAFAVVWVAIAYAWASLRNGGTVRALAMSAGLACALWMPLHNVAYGHEFHLISRSGATVSVPLGPGDYAAAAMEVARGDTRGPHLVVAAHQVKGWLRAEGFIMLPQLRAAAQIMHAVKLLALVVTVWVAMAWLLPRSTIRSDLGVIAVASLCAHLPMLFIFTTNYRYAMLGWDLSMVVMVVWLARLRRAVPVRMPTPAPHLARV